MEISTSELFNGENNELDEETMIKMLARIQKLENQKNTIFGIMLIILGIACVCFSQFLSGDKVKDFLSGLLLGISIGEMLIGVFITTFSLYKQ